MQHVALSCFSSHSPVVNSSRAPRSEGRAVEVKRDTEDDADWIEEEDGDY